MPTQSVWGESLCQVVGWERASAFAQALPLSKSADIGKKHAWARAVCGYLEERYDEGIIRQIRRGCRCNDGKAIVEKLQGYLKRADSPQAFVDAFNAKEDFASLEYRSERALLFCYPVCYCACVKRVPETLFRTWCLCTLGNAEAIFMRALGQRVEVTLLESIKTGATRCALRIEWEKPVSFSGER